MQKKLRRFAGWWLFLAAFVLFGYVQVMDLYARPWFMFVIRMIFIAVLFQYFTRNCVRYYVFIPGPGSEAYWKEVSDYPTFSGRYGPISAVERPAWKAFRLLALAGFCLMIPLLFTVRLFLGPGSVSLVGFATMAAVAGMFALSLDWTGWQVRKAARAPGHEIHRRFEERLNRIRRRDRLESWRPTAQTIAALRGLEEISPRAKELADRLERQHEAEGMPPVK